MGSELGVELMEDSAERASFYGFLSSLYLLELSAEQVERFRALDFSVYKGFDALMDAGFADMERYFASSEGKDVRQELASDYAHSILGVTADERRMAMPYESLFTSKGGLLMQEARDDIYRLYCQEHLGTPEGKDIPEDHLGLMFEFMVHLCERYNAALAAGAIDEAQRILACQQEVAGNHLANWIEDYCATLEDVARTDFYRGLAKVTQGWVMLDISTIDNMVIDTEDEGCSVSL